MKIRYLGHAAFLITSDQGVRIITDPYKPGCFDGGIKYDAITEEADIVTISHEHDDHNETRIKGNPKFVKDAGKHEIKGVSINGTEVFHDTSRGQERGRNMIYSLSMDGMKIVHLGDLGHSLSADEVKAMGTVDVLLVPVGGYFTIDGRVAENIVRMLKPKIVVPMHYKTDKCGFPIAAVEGFTKGKDVIKMDGEVEITKDKLPAVTAIYLLTPTK